MSMPVMLKTPGIDKSTKCCELTVHLVTGVRMVGTYHVPISTSSAIRPSDALRDCKDGFVLLTNVTLHDANEPRQQTAVMVRMDAISHIELPPKGWAARETAPA